MESGIWYCLQSALTRVCVQIQTEGTEHHYQHNSEDLVIGDSRLPKRTQEDHMFLQQWLMSVWTLVAGIMKLDSRT